VVRELDRLRLGYLHMVEPGPADPVGPGPRLDAAFFRPLWRTALVANKAYDLTRANAVLAAGHADLVSFATLYIANPDLPERFRRGAPFNPSDRKTFYGGAAPGYTDYPLL
jgi:N-ethylmaleimide reductase